MLYLVNVLCTWTRLTWSILWSSVRWKWLIILFNSSISQLIFCLVVLLIIERDLLTSEDNWKFVYFLSRFFLFVFSSCIFKLYFMYKCLELYVILTKETFHWHQIILFMHPTPVLLPGKSLGRRSLVGCSPWGRSESDMTEWLHFHFSLSYIGGGEGNPLQCSCLGCRLWVAQSRTQLKWLSSSS